MYMYLHVLVLKEKINLLLCSSCKIISLLALELHKSNWLQSMHSLANAGMMLVRHRRRQANIIPASAKLCMLCNLFDLCSTRESGDIILQK